jgi:hypothetical protein
MIRANATDINLYQPSSKLQPGSIDGNAYFSTPAEAARFVREGALYIQGEPLVPSARVVAGQPAMRCKVQIRWTRHTFIGTGSVVFLAAKSASDAIKMGEASFKGARVYIHGVKKIVNDKDKRYVTFNGFPEVASQHEIEIWIQELFGPIQGGFNMKFNKPEDFKKTQDPEELAIVASTLRSLIVQAVPKFTEEFDVMPALLDNTWNYAVLYLEEAGDAAKLVSALDKVKNDALGLITVYPDVGCTVRVPFKPDEWKRIAQASQELQESLQKEFRGVSIKLVEDSVRSLFNIHGSVTRSIQIAAKALKTFISGKLVTPSARDYHEIARARSPAFRARVSALQVSQWPRYREPPSVRKCQVP